jgi:hypothetical protein
MKKILVISVYFNQEKFLPYQISCLNKYLSEDFHFCFFDNSIDGMSHVKEKELELGVEYFRVPQNIFTGGGPSTRAGQSLDYSIKTSFSKYPDLNEVLILDSDMFPVRKFSFEDLLEDNDFGGIIQHRGHVFYYNNQLVALKRDRVSNWNNFSFDTASVEGEATDCGGKLFFFFRDDNSSLSRKDFIGIHSNQLSLEASSRWGEIKEIDGENNHLENFFKEDVVLNGGQNFSEVYDSRFLHFRAGSNWINFGDSTKMSREQNLFNYLQNITKN